MFGIWAKLEQCTAAERSTWTTEAVPVLSRFSLKKLHHAKRWAWDGVAALQALESQRHDGGLLLQVKSGAVPGPLGSVPAQTSAARPAACAAPRPHLARCAARQVPCSSSDARPNLPSWTCLAKAGHIRAFSIHSLQLLMQQCAQEHGETYEYLQARLRLPPSPQRPGLPRPRRPHGPPQPARRPAPVLPLGRLLPAPLGSAAGAPTRHDRAQWMLFLPAIAFSWCIPVWMVEAL